MTALVDADVRYAIEELVRDLAGKRYEAIAADGRIGRVSVEGLAEAIARYGHTLVALPVEAWVSVDSYVTSVRQNLDVPWWTEEEGEGDLMLFVEVTRVNGRVHVTIDDVRVP